VWWFFLFWAPAYFSELGYPSSSSMGQALIFVLYLIVTLLSIYGGYLPKLFVEKMGMNPYAGRMRAMLIFAFLPIFAMFAQPLAGISPWWPCIIIGLAGAGHQAWSANLYSTIGDMFPKSAIATITGIGTMFGGLCSFAINKGSGMLFTYAEEQGEAFSFMSQFIYDAESQQYVIETCTGKPAGYMIVFCYCAVAYLIGWFIMKTLVPKYKPITK
jgi:ACS family hexuronate transporter-like MFS transporter